MKYSNRGKEVIEKLNNFTIAKINRTNACMEKIDVLHTKGLQTKKDNNYFESDEFKAIASKAGSTPENLTEEGRIKRVEASKATGLKNKESGHWKEVQMLGSEAAVNAGAPSKAGSVNAELRKAEKKQRAIEFYNWIEISDWFTKKDVVDFWTDSKNPLVITQRYLKQFDDLFESKKVGASICFKKLKQNKTI